MIKILHLADIHIRNNDRFDEYKLCFKRLIKKSIDLKPDYIVIVGDLFENFIEISNEAKILAGELLNALSKVSKVVITRGNHDIRKKSVNRVDSIRAVVRLINNPNVTYHAKSGMYKDGSVTWVVYDHIDKLTDPWANTKKDNSQIYIGLFHDPIQNSTNDLGKVFNEKNYKDIGYFKNNDFLMLGDIHKRQFFSYKEVEIEIEEKELDNYLKKGWKIA